MQTITKKDIVKKIHEKVGLSQRLLHQIVDTILEEIKKTLELGEEVKIVRFGTFIPYKTKERIGRNLKTKEEVKIQSFKKVVFHLAPQFKKELRNEKG